MVEDAEIEVGIPPKAKKQIWRAQNNFTKELSKIVSPLHIDDSMQETVDEIQYQIQLLCEKLVALTSHIKRVRTTFAVARQGRVLTPHVKRVRTTFAVVRQGRVLTPHVKRVRTTLAVVRQSHSI
ncbi:hypothetical protein MVEG_12419 [Podila verticillata NRRL 6337]|uniref:Uncharacterized protein n=1 Tax=Podila verticillata NRRL 6337 TaxID=1069443 RepID=A0A086TIG6_9FUNG|nr:hypothetical protein MVEG_12419 [Podila verticillata NRRL 6337]